MSAPALIRMRYFPGNFALPHELSHTPFPVTMLCRPLPQTSAHSVPSLHSARLRTHSPWVALLADTALGVALSYYLLRSTPPLPLSAAAELDEVLRSGVVLLLHKPVGLKLNTELANTFGTIAWQCIEGWGWLGAALAPHLCFGLKALGVMAPLIGGTGGVGAVVDCLMVATWQVGVLHWGLAMVYEHQLKIVASLWRLFM